MNPVGPGSLRKGRICIVRQSAWPCQVPHPGTGASQFTQPQVDPSVRGVQCCRLDLRGLSFPPPVNLHLGLAPFVFQSRLPSFWRPPPPLPTNTLTLTGPIKVTFSKCPSWWLRREKHIPPEVVFATSNCLHSGRPAGTGHPKEKPPTRPRTRPHPSHLLRGRL